MPRSGIAVIVLSSVALLALPGTGAAAADPASQFFVARGVKIHYLVEGKGEPVVLIHGLHASATINWKMPGVLAELAKDHQVVALNLPGHGLSDKPDRQKAEGSTGSRQKRSARNAPAFAGRLAAEGAEHAEGSVDSFTAQGVRCTDREDLK